VKTTLNSCAILSQNPSIAQQQLKRLTNPANNVAFIVNRIYSGFYIKEIGMDFWILIGVVAAWFIINRWILPKMGVPT